MKVTTARGVAHCVVFVLAACVGETTDETLSDVEQEVLIPGETAAWVVWNDGGGVDLVRSYNSTGGGYGVSAGPTGSYTVSINNFTSANGNAQVTALGTSNARCKVSSQATFAGGVNIGVLCHNGAGAAANSAFVLSYSKFAGGTALNSQGAYVWMNQLTGGTLNASRMWGDVITVTWLSAGVYRLNFAGQSLVDGNFEVTAWGTGQSYCKMTSWTASTATVSCYTSGGTATNSRFSLRYTRSQAVCGAGLHDTPGGGGYVWVIGTTPPTLPAAYSFNWNAGTACACSNAGTNTVEKKAVGWFLVHYSGLGGLGVRQAPIATARGPNAAYCKLRQLGESGSSGEMEVNCYNNTGAALVDSDFFQILFSAAQAEC